MLKTEYHKDLTRLNTFGMRVEAKAFIEYDSVADLVELDLEGYPRPVLHIGGGSNLLFTGDFKGTVLHSKIKFIEPLESDPLKISVGAGVVFDDFCKWACDRQLWGVENLSGIPGEVGAAAVQNIGAYGVEVKDVISRVFCYDLQEEEFVSFGVEDCAYGYRDSIFKHPGTKGRHIVTHVVFQLNNNSVPKLDYGHLKDAVDAAAQGRELTPHLVRKTVLDIRNQKLPDPAKIGSAGSFFKNPVVSRGEYEKIASEYENVRHFDLGDAGVKIPAAWMIEQCGWKGRRQGGAAVWEKQPLVIVNHSGNAFPEEVTGLERRIIESVRAKFGVVLSPEVEHIY